MNLLLASSALIQTSILGFFSAQDLIVVLLVFGFVPIVLLVYVIISLQRRKEQSTLLNQILTELRILNSKS